MSLPTPHTCPLAPSCPARAEWGSGGQPRASGAGPRAGPPRLPSIRPSDLPAGKASRKVPGPHPCPHTLCHVFSGSFQVKMSFLSPRLSVPLRSSRPPAERRDTRGRPPHTPRAAADYRNGMEDGGATAAVAGAAGRGGWGGGGESGGRGRSIMGMKGGRFAVQKP